MNQGNNVEPPTRSLLLSTYWRDPEYLAHVPLTSSTALDYFSRSSFFDPSSTNEMLRMQNIVQIMQFQNGIMGMGKTARQQEEELTRFKGIEFVLVYAKEPKQQTAPGSGPSTAGMTLPQGPSAIEETLFVIQKRRRVSPVETHVLETYYIANGNVHMAPDVETILNNRMVSLFKRAHTTLTFSLKSDWSLHACSPFRSQHYIPCENPSLLLDQLKVDPSPPLLLQRSVQIKENLQLDRQEEPWEPKRRLNPSSELVRQEAKQRSSRR